MKYKIRPGVFLTNICDEHFLVSGKDARDHCPYVTRLNDTACYIWKKLVSELPEDEILKSIQNEYETDNINEMKEILNSFIFQLKDAGYIIEEEDCK